MHELRKSNPFRVIIGHINVNSVRNKFESLKEMIKDSIDIFFALETKLDDTFCIDGYSAVYRLDRTSHSGGILMYFREESPSKMLKFQLVQSTFEGFFVEINLRKKTCLLSCLYNPKRKKQTF